MKLKNLILSQVPNKIKHPREIITSLILFLSETVSSVCKFWVSSDSQHATFWGDQRHSFLLCGCASCHHTSSAHWSLRDSMLPNVQKQIQLHISHLHQHEINKEAHSRWRKNGQHRLCGYRLLHSTLHQKPEAFLSHSLCGSWIWKWRAG